MKENMKKRKENNFLLYNLSNGILPSYIYLIICIINIVNKYNKKIK